MNATILSVELIITANNFLFDRYDMWSVGVVMLELILGTPNVFQINARTQTLLDPHIVGWNEDLKELAYKLVLSNVLL